jgi:hypothetical protein
MKKGRWRTWRERERERVREGGRERQKRGEQNQQHMF